MNVKLIYNPVAGMATFKNNLDYVIEQFQEKGRQIIPYRTKTSMDAYHAAAQIKQGQYEKIVVVGGDGTINQVINGLLQNNVDVPIGIIPAGTANVLAYHLSLPKIIKSACNIILNNEYSLFDVGQVNNQYFINIASAGLLTDVAYKIDLNLKNNLGKLAYYLKGLEQLPRFHPITIDLESQEYQFQGQVYLFLIMNGKSAGGFTRVAPKADMGDGLLDVILFKPCPLPELVSLFIKVVKGEHLHSPYISYFRTKELNINCATPLATDLDGEKGPDFPLNIKCIPQKLKIFVPNSMKKLEYRI